MYSFWQILLLTFSSVMHTKCIKSRVKDLPADITRQFMRTLYLCPYNKRCLQDSFFIISFIQCNIYIYKQQRSQVARTSLTVLISYLQISLNPTCSLTSCFSSSLLVFFTSHMGIFGVYIHTLWFPVISPVNESVNGCRMLLLPQAGLSREGGAVCWVGFNLAKGRRWGLDRRMYPDGIWGRISGASWI